MTTNALRTGLDRRRYRLGRRQFTASVRLLRYWLLSAAAIVLIGSPAVALIWHGSDITLWAPTISILQWFAAAIAGMWLASTVPSLIANGLTRKELTAAFLVFGALTGLTLGILAVVGFAAEHALLAAVAEPLDTWGQAIAKGARYLLVAPVYFFAGAAVVALALRFGKEGAFLVTLLLVVPLTIFAGTLSLEFFGYGVDVDTWAFATWLAAGLAFLAALIATVVLALRSIPIRPKGA
ncbi:MAG TPA: hypothetical protein VHG10_06440 [Glycomyces sp.]|nr:hypothetical protein [Glycomyces sp.]